MGGTEKAPTGHRPRSCREQRATERVNRILNETEFDRFVEDAEKFYAAVMGRPSLAPKYFRMLLVGYFEGIDSERGIAWRCADSLSLREFLGVGLSDAVPDHSTVSRNG